MCGIEGEVGNAGRLAVGLFALQFSYHLVGYRFRQIVRRPVPFCCWASHLHLEQAAWKWTLED